MEKTSLFITVSIMMLSIAQIVWVIFKSREWQLTEREKAVEQALELGLFERVGQGINDGFIFCSLWRLSDVQRRAQGLGVVLTLAEAYLIVGHLKRGHDKEVGINNFVIDMAIREYVRENKLVPNGWGYDESEGLLMRV